MLDKTDITVKLLDTTLANLYMLSEALEKETGNKVGVGRVVDIIVHQLLGTVSISNIVEHSMAYKDELLARKPRSKNEMKKTAGMNEESVQ